MPAQAQWEAGVQLQPIRNPALEGEGWPTPRSGRFILGKDEVLLVQELAEPRGWSGRYGKSCLTGIRSPDRPVRGMSIY